MESDKEVALYYPYTDIDDVSLIKTAALYWDELQTIVPQDVQQPYKNQISLEAEANRFLKRRDVMCDDNAVEQAGNEFVKDTRTISLIKNIFLPQLYSRLQRSEVYHGKISLVCREKLLVYFEECVNEAGNAYVMPEILANAYMSRLASVIAYNDGTIPLTNDEFGNSILQSRYIDYSSERRQNQAELVKLSLKTISVNPDVPLVKILRFRDKHREDLINYRMHVRQLIRAISYNLNNSDKQCLFEEIVKDEFLPVKEEVEAKLSENTDWFMINNTVIMIAGMGATILSDGQAWLARLLSSVVALGINVLGNIRDDRKCIKNHPLGYLYQAQKKFGAKN
jgi:hypothetical protein